MFTTYRIMGLAFVLLLGGCVTMAGRDEVTQVMNEKYTGKVVSIADFKMGSKMGYTLEPEGLKLLSDLGVVCKDDEAALQKTYKKLGSVAYCENDPLAKNHVMLLKIAMAPGENSGNVMAKHFDAWMLQAKLAPGNGDSLICTDQSPRQNNRGNSFTDCVFTYHGKKYFIAVMYFPSLKFDNVRQMLIFGNVQDASGEAKNETRKLAEKIAALNYHYFY